VYILNRTNNPTNAAILYQSLYLANLLLLPVISFLVLVWFLVVELKAKNKISISRFSRVHLIRAIQLSVVAGVFLVIIPLFFMLFTSQFSASLMFSIVYFVTFHALFILIGMFNLSRAMTKKLPLF
jgi:hypothetical protein